MQSVQLPRPQTEEYTNTDNTQEGSENFFEHAAYIPLAPEDLQINLASGKARAAPQRNVAHSSCAKGIYRSHHKITKKILRSV
jgi:hypothetical protein